MSEHETDRAWLLSLQWYTDTELEVILCNELLPEWKAVAIGRELLRRDRLARLVLKGKS